MRAFTTLILVFAAACLGGPVALFDRAVNHLPMTDEAICSVFRHTELDEMVVDRTFAQHFSAADPSMGTNWGCNADVPGPDPLDCPTAIGSWTNAAIAAKATTIKLAAGWCQSWSFRSCRTTACALDKGDVTLDVGILTGRMWKPCQIFCAVNNRAGVWQSPEDDVLVKMDRAVL